MPDRDEEVSHTMHPPRGSVPDPDPSERTREDLKAKIADERKITDGQLDTLRERLAGIDKATELRLGGIVGIPEQIDEKVGHLAQTTAVRFEAIDQQFSERDVRSEREARDNTKAVDAAFAAQAASAAKQEEANQKAIDKSEKATKEAIDKLGELFKSTTDAQSDKISALERRAERLESLKAGGQQAYTGLYAMGGLIVAVAAVIVAVLLSQP